jgi:hypothetical protein
MESNQIFKIATLHTDKEFCFNLKEGICIEDECYIQKILSRSETEVHAVICQPQAGDVIAAKVMEILPHIV